MRSIEVRNVNEALPAGLAVLLHQGVEEDSRAGPVVVAPWPVATVYHHPRERVLLSPHRNANPFFHLMEAMWMLSGRDDATFLDTYVGDFSKRFGEPPAGRQHGAYGFRWRRWFGDESPIDQLEVVSSLLRDDPTTRRAVLTMWDPAADLVPDGPKLDIPCNTQAFFRVREGVLHMMVTCRSNDIIWGAYGANAVHFSLLLEYVAAMAGYEVGTYTQLSFNFHAYTSILDKMDLTTLAADSAREYPGSSPVALVEDPRTFHRDLDDVLAGDDRMMRNRFLSNTVNPMMVAHRLFKQRNHVAALVLMAEVQSPDWRVAGTEWIQRRAR